jgi:hypothetical protein
MIHQYAKDVVARKITECIAQFKPGLACFITTAWSLDFDKLVLPSRDGCLDKRKNEDLRAS